MADSDSSLMDEEDSMVRSQVFADITVTFTGLKKNLKDELTEMVNKLGGRVSASLDSKVTHVIAENCDPKSDKYKEATRRKLPVVLPEWIYTAAGADDTDTLTMSVITSAEIVNTFKTKLFTGCEVTVSGFSGAERVDIGHLVELHGGVFSSQMSRTSCTHLIAATNSGEKYRRAREWGTVKVVSSRWLRKCIEMGYHLPEERFALDKSEDEEQQSANNSYSSSTMPLGSDRKENKTPIPITTPIPATQLTYIISKADEEENVDDNLQHGLNSEAEEQKLVKKELKKEGEEKRKRQKEEEEEGRKEKRRKKEEQEQMKKRKEEEQRKIEEEERKKKEEEQRKKEEEEQKRKEEEERKRKEEEEQRKMEEQRQKEEEEQRKKMEEQEQRKREEEEQKMKEEEEQRKKLEEEQRKREEEEQKRKQEEEEQKRKEEEEQRKKEEEEQQRKEERRKKEEEEQKMKEELQKKEEEEHKKMKEEEEQRQKEEEERKSKKEEDQGKDEEKEQQGGQRKKKGQKKKESEEQRKKEEEEQRKKDEEEQKIMEEEETMKLETEEQRKNQKTMLGTLPAREHVLVMSEGDPMEGEGTRISIDLMRDELRDLVDELEITCINARDAREYMEQNNPGAEPSAGGGSTRSKKSGRTAYVLRTPLPAHRVLNVLAESAYTIQKFKVAPGGEHGASHRYCWVLIRSIEH